MKLSAFAKIAKKSHETVVFTKGFQTGESSHGEMILSNGSALYRCGCIPEVFGEPQICALLDITQKQREKILITEHSYESLKDIAAGFNLEDGETPDEADTEECKIRISYNGKDFVALKCGDGETVFYNSNFLAPLREEVDSPYFKIRSRISAGGAGGKRFRYLIAKDGFRTLAAFMPIIALTDEFMKDLNAFVEDCTMQKQIEDNRIAECREAKSK